MFGKLGTGLVASLAVAGVVGLAGLRTAQASGVRVSLNFPIVLSTPAPVYTAPQPVYTAPQPVYTETQPVYSTPQQGYNNYGDPNCAPPAPVVEAPQPVYYQAPQPVYYQAPQPVYVLPPQRPIYVAPRVLVPPYEYRRPLPAWRHDDWRHDDHHDNHDNHASVGFGFSYRR